LIRLVGQGEFFSFTTGEISTCWPSF